MDPVALRSLLFVPGDNERRVLKALGSQADAVIVDLEDAVAPANKGQARALTRDLLNGADRHGKPVFVRVNGFDTGMTATDLSAIMPGKPWGVVLPKCQNRADLSQLSQWLHALETRDQIAAGTTRILSVATETAVATLNLSGPGGYSKARLWGFLWGGEDLSAALGATANRDELGSYTFPFQFARSQCLYAASAAGAQAVDAVYTNIKDLQGLERETRLGLRDGFSAKAAIHPVQLEVINRVMTPTDSQVQWARQVVELLKSEAVAQLEGRMIDLVHKRMAERLLVRAASLRGAAAN
jgi:citrate lyase subunit beta / citryl-CoA lyase